MGGHFDYEGKIKEINNLNKEVNSEDFWNRSDSNQILSLLSSLKIVLSYMKILGIY